MITEGHAMFELIYDMLTGIKDSVVESYAVRAEREEEMNLHYALPQILLLPKDFTAIQKFNYKL